MRLLGGPSRGLSGIRKFSIDENRVDTFRYRLDETLCSCQGARGRIGALRDGCWDGAGPVGPEVYSFTPYIWYRPDIRVRLQDQVNVDLTGYKVKIKKGELKPGFYQIGMLAIDRTSRLKLINWVPNILHVKN